MEIVQPSLQMAADHRGSWSEMKLTECREHVHWLLLLILCSPQLVGLLLFMVQLTGCLVVLLHLITSCPEKVNHTVCGYQEIPSVHLTPRSIWVSWESTESVTGLKPPLATWCSVSEDLMSVLQLISHKPQFVFRTSVIQF